MLNEVEKEYSKIEANFVEKVLLKLTRLMRNEVMTRACSYAVEMQRIIAAVSNSQETKCQMKVKNLVGTIRATTGSQTRNARIKNMNKRTVCPEGSCK